MSEGFASSPTTGNIWPVATTGSWFTDGSALVANGQRPVTASSYAANQIYSPTGGPIEVNSITVPV